MKLRVLTPLESFIEEGVIKITAENEKGYFCLLPKHIDFVSILTAGILSYEKSPDEIIYMAVDEGVLVKKDDEVSISVSSAFKGKDLADLERVVTEKYEHINEEEKKSRKIIAKLEADFTKHILELR